MTAKRPELPPGVTAYTRTDTWMLRDAGGTLLQRGVGSYAEAVAQAWVIHDVSPDPWVTYADELELEAVELREQVAVGDEARLKVVNVLGLLAIRGCDCEVHPDEMTEPLCLECQIGRILQPPKKRTT